MEPSRGEYQAFRVNGSIFRFIGKAFPLISLESVEFNDYGVPVALVKTYEARNRLLLDVRPLVNLARLCQLPLYLVGYETGTTYNPCVKWALDIVKFYVKSIHPKECEMEIMEPKEFCEWLAKIREEGINGEVNEEERTIDK